ncbi:MAG TPA: YbhN family protein [Nocardioidaceae bacterium]|nr:YbhN family protein [Nocardioidaceae bacterium]
MTPGDDPGEPASESQQELARQASKIFETPKLSPLQILVRAVLVAVLLYLIFGVLIPNFADYDEVWEAITSLSAAGIVLMIVLTLTIELLKAAAPSLLIDDLRLGQAFVTQGAAATVSNTIPGPSGVITKYAIYRRFGIDFIDFSRASVMNGVWSNLVALILPSIAMLLLATQEAIPHRVLAVTLLALCLSVVVVAIGVCIIRSERFARRFGELTGQLINWMRGLVNRPPSEAVGEAVVRFRFDVLETARHRGLRLTALVVGKEFCTYLALLVAVRSVDIERFDLTAIEVFAAYTFVRLLTLVEITPGNVGIAETLYISTLSWATPETSNSGIVGAVFVFRMFTYLGPIIMGGGCWLWLRYYFRRHPTPTGETVKA